MSFANICDFRSNVGNSHFFGSGGTISLRKGMTGCILGLKTVKETWKKWVVSLIIPHHLSEEEKKSNREVRDAFCKAMYKNYGTTISTRAVVESGLPHDMWWQDKPLTRKNVQLIIRNAELLKSKEREKERNKSIEISSIESSNSKSYRDFMFYNEDESFKNFYLFDENGNRLSGKEGMLRREAFFDEVRKSSLYSSKKMSNEDFVRISIDCMDRYKSGIISCC